VADSAKPCPICGKPPVCDNPMQARFRPFCSARCADIDLGRWFTESYAVPAPPPELAEDEDDAAGPR
jgi:hypothetical protein